ncbi:MAG: hypothetical protein ACPGUV_04370 [Polyangiales bacterium]
MKLAQALDAAQLATRESAAIQTLDPFANRVAVGVSANLCDAMADVLEATRAEVVDASFSYASSRPLLTAVPRLVTFSADTAPILREAAHSLRAEATYPETEVSGPVVKLDSEDPSQGGHVVLRALVEEHYRNVHLHLDADFYATAIQAHREHSIVQCIGERLRDGRRQVLRHVRAFAVLDTDVDDCV